MIGIPGKPSKFLRNSGIPQDFESAGSRILQKLQLSFLGILKFLGAQFSVVHWEGGIFSGIAQCVLWFKVTEFTFGGKCENLIDQNEFLYMAYFYTG